MATKKTTAPPARKDSATALARTGARPDEIMTPASVKVPEYMKTDTGMGTEDMGREDITLPRLALAQSLTRQLKRSNALYVEGLKEGDLFNTLTGKAYPTPLKVLPLFMYKTRIFFHPLDQGGGIDCQSFNARDGGHYSPTCESCPHNQWTPEAKGTRKPDCNLFYNYVMLITPTNEVAVLSLKSTGIKVAKAFNSLVRMYGGNLMFSRFYELTPKEEKNNAGEFYNLAIRPLEWTPAPLFESAKALFQNLRAKPFKVDIDKTGDEPSVGAPEAEDSSQSEL